MLYESDADGQENNMAENPFFKLRVSLTDAEKDALDLKDSAYCGHYEEKAFIKYYGIQQPSRSCMFLPKDHTYRIELIDTRERKKSVLMSGASGTVWFDMPGKEKMAVLAVAED